MKYFFSILALMPIILMLTGMFISLLSKTSVAQVWRLFTGLSLLALASTLVNLCIGQTIPQLQPWLKISLFGTALAFLVQLLCTVIAVFSKRYLEGEPEQKRYVSALAGVLAAVHLLLTADHWVVLITAWALVGIALEHLLCFYPERAFALLAAHKKQIADRVADVMLITAAALAWSEVGSGSLSDLWAHIEQNGMSTILQFSAVCLVLAVILRTALLPVHGWLIQVMEAPTPVSALLHAGVVNLGGYVLIRFAPLLELAMPARSLLMIFGLGTALLAGLVMLTRISIKVRLAWSTTAQMGFMVLECGLGLYTLAALHLFGHSLYKAHTFLSASGVVRQTHLQEMRGMVTPIPLSLLLTPAMAIIVVFMIQSMFSNTAWPWWWSAILGLAWAPLLWLPAQSKSVRKISLHMLSGLLMVAGLTIMATTAHILPLDIHDAPNNTLGVIVLIGMIALYFCLVMIQIQPHLLRVWRRWSYAGFYVDEIYTRMALRIWPTRWTSGSASTSNTSAPL